MGNLFDQRAKVDIKVIFRNGSSFEHTQYGIAEDLLNDTRDLLEARMQDWEPGKMYRFGQWSFDLSKVMALHVGDIRVTNDGPEVKIC